MQKVCDMEKGIESIFKPHLEPREVYKGGKNIPKQKDKKIYKLSSNENPLGQSPKATEALLRAAHQIAIYPDQTDIRLREALAEDFNKHIDRYQLLYGNSRSKIYDMLIRALITYRD